MGRAPAGPCLARQKPPNGKEVWQGRPSPGSPAEGRPCPRCRGHAPRETTPLVVLLGPQAAPARIPEPGTRSTVRSPPAPPRAPEGGWAPYHPCWVCAPPLTGSCAGTVWHPATPAPVHPVLPGTVTNLGEGLQAWGQAVTVRTTERPRMKRAWPAHLASPVRHLHPGGGYAWQGPPLGQLAPPGQIGCSGPFTWAPSSEQKVLFPDVGEEHQPQPSQWPHL